MGNKKPCSASYIPRLLIEHTITNFISQKLTNADYMKELIQKMYDDDTIKRQETQIEEIRDRIRLIDKRRMHCLDLYSDNLYTKEELELKIRKLNAEKAGLMGQLEEISNVSLLKNQIKVEQKIQLMAETLFDFPYWSAFQKREFLRRQVHDIIVKKDGITGITVNFGKLCNRMGKDS